MSTASTLARSDVAVARTGIRFGLKGSDAPALLQYLGLRVPARPNSVARWLPDEVFGSGRCLRQGSSEFLIELDATTQPQVLARNEAFANAWVLIRSDHSLLLTGAHWPRELAQVCSFDFARLHDEPDLVVMTLVAGIGVTLIAEPAPDTNASQTALRLWCDASFSTYLQQCLYSIGGSR